jgi:hypothetical protein
MLPADIVDRTLIYINHEADQQASSLDSTDILELIYRPLHPLAAQDGSGFTEELAEAVLPAGGLAARGGARLIWDLIGSDGFTDPHWERMVDAALDWMHQQRYSFAQLFRYEADRWMKTHGSFNDW